MTEPVEPRKLDKRMIKIHVISSMLALAIVVVAVMSVAVEPGLRTGLTAGVCMLSLAGYGIYANVKCTIESERRKYWQASALHWKEQAQQK